MSQPDDRGLARYGGSACNTCGIRRKFPVDHPTLEGEADDGLFDH